jgi:hypothetical protein
MVKVSVLQEDLDLVLQVAERIASRTNSRVVIRSERLNVVDVHKDQMQQQAGHPRQQSAGSH